MNIVEDSVILVTGGTGSVGRAFIREVSKYHPKLIKIYSRGELLQKDMRDEFCGSEYQYIIGDIRDLPVLTKAIKGVDLVIHTAALKEIVSCEYNPFETVKTNVIGTMNIIEACIDNNVEKVVAISTDKACYPVSTYGETKALMERLIVRANTFSTTIFSCARYGNVLMSRGSVLPIWQKQRSTGIISITDKDMSRFWVTDEFGAKFIIDVIGMMKGGEIYIPKMVTKRIVDLAKEIVPECTWNIIGVRAGEKLHEVVLTAEESKHTRDCGDYYVIEPEFQSYVSYSDGRKLPEGFIYKSND